MPLLSEEDFYREVSERVQTARYRDKITLEDVANFLNLTKSTVSNMEKGRHRPSLYQVIMLAERFSIDYTDLIPAERRGAKTDAVEKPADVEKEIDQDKVVTDIKTELDQPSLAELKRFFDQ